MKIISITQVSDVIPLSVWTKASKYWLAVPELRYCSSDSKDNRKAQRLVIRPVPHRQEQLPNGGRSFLNMCGKVE